jgi:hypothetical protein
MSTAPFAELLSFRLRVARTTHDIHAACKVRSEAYGRHLPHLRGALVAPDELDGAEGVVVFLCVDKRSGSAIGTVRLQTSSAGPLLIEQSVQVPEEVRRCTRAELTRLAVVPGADPLTKLSLMKATFLYCRAAQIRYMVIGARSRGLIRQYEELAFTPLFDGEMFPLKHAANIPHQVLVNDLSTIELRMQASGSTWPDFVHKTWHPDIDLLSPRPALAASDAGEMLAAA